MDLKDVFSVLVAELKGEAGWAGRSNFAFSMVLFLLARDLNKADSVFGKLILGMDPPDARALGFWIVLGSYALCVLFFVGCTLFVGKKYRSKASTGESAARTTVQGQSSSDPSTTTTVQ